MKGIGLICLFLHKNKSENQQPTHHSTNIYTHSTYTSQTHTTHIHMPHTHTHTTYTHHTTNTHTPHKYKAAQSHLWPVTTGLDGADFRVFPSTQETSLTQDQCCPLALCDDKNVLYLHQLNFHLKWVL